MRASLQPNPPANAQASRDRISQRRLNEGAAGYAASHASHPEQFSRATHVTWWTWRRAESTHDGFEEGMAMNVALIVVSLIVTGVVVGWFLSARRVPESAASHHPAGEGPSSTSDELYAGSDRPAGPDAESMNPDAIGGDQSPPRQKDTST